MTETATSMLGALPDEWGEGPFDSLFEVQQGKQVSKATRKGDNQRPFLRTKNVFWDHLDITDLDRMHFQPSEEMRLALKRRDLLICEGGDIGRTAICNEDLSGCYFQNHLHRARLRDDALADPEFVLFWLWYAFEVGEVYFGRGNVTTIPNLSKAKLSELPVPIPPLEEQRQIATVLRLVRSAIKQQDRRLTIAEELKSALVEHLFARGTHGRDPKDTAIGRIPADWEVVSLGSISEKPQYGFTESAQSQGSVRFLRITDIQPDGVDWEDVPFCPCPEDVLPQYRLEHDDLVFARIGATTGKSFLVKSPPLAVSPPT